MATETLYFSDMDISDNCTITDPSNVIGQYNVATCTLGPTGSGDWYGGGDVDNTAEIPTDLISVKARYWNSGSSLDADDTLYFQFYDYDTTSWINIFTYNTEYPIPTEETEFEMGGFLKNYYMAAADKILWVNSLAFRWYHDVVKAQSEVVISTQGVEVVIEYTPPTGGPRGPLGQPFHGPFGGPIV